MAESEEFPSRASAELEREAERLRAAIREHRSQHADDRCIEDDDRLYAALGDGIACDRRVGSKEEMLANCSRFIERRCAGGEWLSYVALERRVADLLAACRAFVAWDEDPHATEADAKVLRQVIVAAVAGAEGRETP